jgi:NADPH:quinone reductase-like Zn-dependent oxidoreductase
MAEINERKVEDMKAIFLNKIAGPEALGYGELPRPQPAAGEALVRIFATAITPTELQWVPTWKQRTGHPRRNLDEPAGAVGKRMKDDL